MRRAVALANFFPPLLLGAREFFFLHCHSAKRRAVALAIFSPLAETQKHARPPIPPKVPQQNQAKLNYQGGVRAVHFRSRARQSLITKGGSVIKPGRRQVDGAREVHFRSRARQSLITKGGSVIKPGRRQVDRARAVHFRSRDRQSIITKGGSVIKPGRRQVDGAREVHFRSRARQSLITKGGGR